MPFCQCEKVSLYYEKSGPGTPLLLISGLSGGSWSWYGQVPYFQRHYQTITFDNRGAGRSGTPPGPYRMRQFAADIVCLLDHLELPDIFLLGLSMGGMIAQELALMVPNRVRAMVLGCTHCGGERRIPPPAQVLARFVNNQGLTQEQIIDKNIPFFFSSRCLRTRPDVVELYREAQLLAPLQAEAAFHAQFAAIRDFNCCDQLSELHIPTLIITGTEDLLVPAENARLLARRISTAELVEIPGAGHALHAECRDQLNALVHEFLQRHEKDPCAPVIDPSD
jgi:3-oxoadipate enol-lactonase